MAAGQGYIEFATGDVLTAASANGYLASQVVMVFADSAARTAAIASPQEGMFSYLKDTNATEYYTGSAWTAIGGGGLSSPLTTKGDIWGYSTTDARVPVGINGQVLTADSTNANGVAWATAGGGNFIKIASGTFTNQASVAVDSCFSSTYTNYILIANAFAVTDTDDFQIQFRYSGSTQTSTYYGAYTQIDRANSVTNAGYTNAGQGLLAISMETTAKAASRVNLTITNVGISGNPAAYGTGLLSNGPAAIDIAFFQDTARTYDGFLLKSSSTNITGNYAIYGVSN